MTNVKCQITDEYWQRHTSTNMFHEHEQRTRTRKFKRREKDFLRKERVFQGFRVNGFPLMEGERG